GGLDLVLTETGTAIIKRDVLPTRLPPGHGASLTSGYYSLAVRDFTGDGLADVLAIADYDTAFRLMVAQRDETLSPPAKMDALSRSRHLVAADFDGNGMPDIAVAGGLDGHELGVYVNQYPHR